MKEIEEKIQILQNEVNFLKQKLENLENDLENQNIGKEKELNILLDMPKAALKTSFPSKQYNPFKTYVLEGFRHLDQ